MLELEPETAMRCGPPRLSDLISVIQCEMIVIREQEDAMQIAESGSRCVTLLTRELSKMPSIQWKMIEVLST
jgi:hypothetical protein